MSQRSLGSAFRYSTLTLLLAVSLAPALAADDPAVNLDQVVVTATRVPTPAFQVPASVDVVDATGLMDGLGVNLSEGLSGVPGLVARDRQNYAQDTQISIRGFGARTTFGVRGVRLYLDGIPASQPDGQGQVSHFNLATADRIEVLRGPFSSLYGYSSGGVIQMFTADGGEPTLRAGFAAGSHDTWRADLGASGQLRRGDYNLGYTQFDTNGSREHSAAERRSANGKLNLQLTEHGRLTLVANHLSAPDAQDPLGLTREQWLDDPTQATSVALSFNTRKSVEQTQAGAIWEQGLGPHHALRLMAYGGTREVEQFLSVPPSAQASPTSSGGVVQLDNGYGGGDLRWQFQAAPGGRALTLIAGLAYERLSQDRLGYENFIGETLGVQGALRRDETNDITSIDQYLQGSLQLSEHWLAVAGLRRGQVEFDSSDHYITEGNPNDSDTFSYSDALPVVGLTWMATPALSVYTAYGRGFETPTFVELAYRPDGESGLNDALEPAQSDNLELGVKAKLGGRALAQLALFTVDTQDEIVVATNFGGRPTYQNAGQTRREGLEASLHAQLRPRLRAQLAWTWIDATVEETYYTCTGTPCLEATTPVAAGNRIPGVPESSLYGQLAWGGSSGWQLALDGQYLSKVEVNDVNDEAAPSYGVLNLSAGYVFTLQRLQLRSTLEVHNLLDEDYVGSVIVNDGSGRYYEPAPDRSVLASLRLTLSR